MMFRFKVRRWARYFGAEFSSVIGIEEPYVPPAKKNEERAAMIDVCRDSLNEYAFSIMHEDEWLEIVIYLSAAHGLPASWMSLSRL